MAAKPRDKVTIYHVEGRRSQRVIWLCEELNIPYEALFKRGDILGSINQIKAVNPDNGTCAHDCFPGQDDGRVRGDP